MKLHIEKHMSLADVQLSFAEQFPFLKLGFFLDKNKDHAHTADEQIHNMKMSIGAIREKEVDGDLRIEGSMSTKEVEVAFRDRFGLEVQVFRKSGNTWLVTSNTDERTLNEQNASAKEMSQPAEMPDMPDYQEHD
jgi:hypothetical protein